MRIYQSIFRTRPFAFSPLVVVAATACSGVDNAPATTSVPSLSLRSIIVHASSASGDTGGGVAEDIVAQNSAAESTFHLVARAYANDDTEVLEFYEPVPGILFASAAGKPTGSAHLSPSFLKGASGLWSAAAPGQPMPRALTDAIARQSAGVGNSALRANPANANPSVSSFGRGSAASASTPKVLGSGYCDATWPSDFPPTTMKGDNCNENSASFYFTYDQMWCPVGDTAYPYQDNSNGCTCTGRVVQAFRDMDVANNDSSYGNNQWVDFVNVCPPLDAFTLTLSGTFSGSWTVPEDTYRWIQGVGTVSCFEVSDTCLSTNDIASFNASADGYGYINYLAEAYGP